MSNLRQRHGIGGVYTTNKSLANGYGESITVQDAGEWIGLDVSDHPLRLSPEQARYLAQQLSDAAARAELAVKPTANGE